MNPSTVRRDRVEVAGFSLIELLVTLVIGLVVTLAITSVLIRSEGGKRSTTSVNDVNETGTYVAFVLDRAIRSAGSGFSQGWATAYGCLLDVSQGSTRVLPFAADAIASASAFAGVTHPIRLAPVVIGKGLADSSGQVRGDVLVVMGGASGAGESARPVLPGSVSTASLRLSNTLGYRTGDLVLLADPGVTGGCMMQQVTFTSPSAGSTDQTLPLAGTYYSSIGTNVSLASFGGSTVVLQMGNALDNPPQFQIYAVGDNSTLFSRDLLQRSAPDAPVEDGVVEMRALYGVDTTTPPDGILESWIDPVAGSGYEVGVLMDGSGVSQARLRSIVAVRVGLILRTTLQERSRDYQLPAGTTLTLFGDLGSSLRRTRTLSGSDLNYRFRTVEFTVPLRNAFLAPAS